MRLVTYQEPGFDIVNTMSVKDKSFYYSTWPEFRKPYDWLYNILGSDKWIWCYHASHDNHCPGFCDELVKWELDVPDNLIMIIDSHTWHCCLNDINCYPDSLYKSVISMSELSKIEEKFDSENQKEKVWRENIFTKDIKKHIEILVPSPIRKEWLIDKSHYCEYNQDMFNDGCCTMWFRNELDFIKYYSTLKNGLIKRNKKIIHETIKQVDKEISLIIDWK